MKIFCAKIHVHIAADSTEDALQRVARCLSEVDTEKGDASSCAEFEPGATIEVCAHSEEITLH